MAAVLVALAVLVPASAACSYYLVLTALGFMTDDDSFKVGAQFTRDRLRGFRLKADADWADSFLGINQVNVTFSQGIHGLGSTDNPDPNVLLPPLPTASTKSGRVDFDKIEGTFARTQPLFAGFSAFVAADGHRVTEPGEYTIRVANLARDVTIR